MPNEPSDGASPAPGGEVWQHTFTPEQDKRLTAVFTEITAVTTLAFESQLEIFEPEDEAYIRREVDRMLYEPKLPNGGDKERHIIERMKALARKQGQGWDGYQRLHYAISQWQAVLPDDPRNAGMYYIRHPISRKEDKAGFDYYRAMKLAASHAQHEELEWFADLMLKGTPEPVSNFAMECLFLLRKSNGDVDRLVRLKNVLGEVSHGTSHKGSDLLVGEAFGGPEKFRIWTLKRGNFSGPGGVAHPGGVFAEAGGGVQTVAGSGRALERPAQRGVGQRRTAARCVVCEWRGGLDAGGDGDSKATDDHRDGRGGEYEHGGDAE